MAIKYCVWDVGQVIYPYTLRHLDEWARANTLDIKSYEAKGGVLKYDYKPYMSGKISDEEFCRQICEQYQIRFDKKTVLEVNKALYKGVGNFFEETMETMKVLSECGVTNCILSNALPMLKGTAPAVVDDKYRFASFELGLLKPNPQIYEEVRERLGCKFEEMIFVDDKKANVEAACSLGIHGIVFNRDSVKKECAKIIKTSGLVRAKSESRVER